jgi:hypothetical protein
MPFAGVFAQVQDGVYIGPVFSLNVDAADEQTPVIASAIQAYRDRVTAIALVQMLRVRHPAGG